MKKDKGSASRQCLLTQHCLSRRGFIKLSLQSLFLGAFALEELKGSDVAETRGTLAQSYKPTQIHQLKKGANMKILIIGANGSVAKWVIEAFLQKSDVSLRLYLRNAKRLKHLQSERVELFEGDVLDKTRLKEAMSGVDVVYANLSGELVKMAEVIIQSMSELKLKRLIWISSMGIYDEVPTQSYKSILNPYRDSALLIEKTNLDYTIIRPAWFSNADEIDYELTKKGESFKNADKQISRKSIADLVVRLALTKDFGIRESLGINKP